MAATARALAASDGEFVNASTRISTAVRGPEYFDPGPLAREIAAWKRDYPEIQLATFNYDQLLERALQDVGVDAEACEDNTPERDGMALVRHLHGLLTGTPADAAVVLTERDYALWPSGSWQDEFMSDALDDVCVFLCLSFTDQNLLHGSMARPVINTSQCLPARARLACRMRSAGSSSPQTEHDWHAQT